MLCRRLGVGSQQSWRRLAEAPAAAATPAAGSPASFTCLTACVTPSDRGGAPACTRSRQLASAGGGGWLLCSHQLPFAARAFHASLAPAARGVRDAGGAVEGALSGDVRARVVEEVKQLPRKQQECVPTLTGALPPWRTEAPRRSSPLLRLHAVRVSVWVSASALWPDTGSRPCACPPAAGTR
jgi:hypothetical protein